jgi:hypothetical protein
MGHGELVGLLVLLRGDVGDHVVEDGEQQFGGRVGVAVDDDRGVVAEAVEYRGGGAVDVADAAYLGGVAGDQPAAGGHHERGGGDAACAGGDDDDP